MAGWGNQASHDGCPEGRTLDRPFPTPSGAQPCPPPDRPGNRAFPGAGPRCRRLRTRWRVRQLPDVPGGAHAHLPHVGGRARGADLQGRPRRDLCPDHAVPPIRRQLPGAEHRRGADRTRGATGEHVPAPDGRERRLPQLRHGRLHAADVRPVHADRRGRVRTVEAAPRAADFGRGRSAGCHRGDAPEACRRRRQRAGSGEPDPGTVGRSGPHRASPGRGRDRRPSEPARRRRR